MKWRWPRRRGPDEDLAADLERLDEVRAQWPAVHEAAQKMRDHKRRNHFAASIAAIYREG